MDLQLSTAASSKHSRKELKAQCIHTCLDLVQCQVQLIEQHAPAALEGCMHSTRNALVEFNHNAAASSALKKRAKKLLKDIEAAVQRSIAVRAAPVCADVVKKNPRKLLNPKFEVDFDKRRDYDPDRERAEYKQYKRMAAKEKRGMLLFFSDACLSRLSRPQDLHPPALRDPRGCISSACIGKSVTFDSLHLCACMDGACRRSAGAVFDILWSCMDARFGAVAPMHTFRLVQC